MNSFLAGSYCSVQPLGSPEQVFAEKEGGVVVVNISFGGKLHGVTQEFEIEVGRPINAQLSGIFAYHPCFGRDVVVE